MQDGTYDNVTARGARLVESPNTKTAGVEIDFHSEHGEAITGTLWITENTVKRVVESLRHAGWQGDDLFDLSTVGSKLCQIVVASEQYKGKWYPKVQWVNANASTGGGGNGLSVLGDSERRAFATKMRGLVIAANGGKPSTPAPRGAGGAPQTQRQAAPGSAPQQQRAPEPESWGGSSPPEDGDIPF